MAMAMAIDKNSQQQQQQQAPPHVSISITPRLGITVNINSNSNSASASAPAPPPPQLGMAVNRNSNSASASTQLKRISNSNSASAQLGMEVNIKSARIVKLPPLNFLSCCFCSIRTLFYAKAWLSGMPRSYRKGYSRMQYSPSSSSERLNPRWDDRGKLYFPITDTKNNYSNVFLHVRIYVGGLFCDQVVGSVTVPIADLMEDHVHINNSTTAAKENRLSFDLYRKGKRTGVVNLDPIKIIKDLNSNPDAVKFANSRFNDPYAYSYGSDTGAAAVCAAAAAHHAAPCHAAPCH